MPTPTDKDALKALREARHAAIERSRQAIKEQGALIKAILSHLGPAGATVPQIAAATGMDSARVLLFVSGLRKYGLVTEGPKEGDYFTYRAAEQSPTG